jgi:hypothetical protein
MKYFIYNDKPTKIKVKNLEDFMKVNDHLDGCEVTKEVYDAKVEEIEQLPKTKKKKFNKKYPLPEQMDILIEIAKQLDDENIIVLSPTAKQLIEEWEISNETT